MKRNPDRDYPIIASRLSLLEAQEHLAVKKSDRAALVVQAMQKKWDTARQLTLVKKKASDD